MDKVNEAILHFYENGFLKESLFLRDGTHDA